ncbi:MAG: hypothetical protein HFI67_10245 [Lachnospiraceae bacterium]|nr:hypothetical protein [Lachnospiraceae bacterium]
MNTKGKNPSGVPKLLVDFLSYVENTTDAFAKKSGEAKLRIIHEKVTGLKRSRKWEGRYMRLGEYIDREVRIGIEEGIREKWEETREKVTEQVTEEVTEEVTERITEEITEKITKNASQRILNLTCQMVVNGEGKLISRLSKEPAFLEEMFQKYHL